MMFSCRRTSLRLPHLRQCNISTRLIYCHLSLYMTLYIDMTLSSVAKGLQLVIV